MAIYISQRDKSEESNEQLTTTRLRLYKSQSYRTPNTSNHPSGSATPKSSRSCSPSPIEVADDTDAYAKAEDAPVFLIYSDSELKNAAKSEALSDELRNRLVRNTVSNMRTACQNLATPREPTNNEMEDMAKALVKKYPSIVRLYDYGEKEYMTISEDKKCDLTQEQKSQFHVSYDQPSS